MGATLGVVATVSVNLERAAASTGNLFVVAIAGLVVVLFNLALWSSSLEMTHDFARKRRSMRVVSTEEIRSPKFLGSLWIFWRAWGAKTAAKQSFLVLFVTYYAALGPISLVSRLKQRPALTDRSGIASYWRVREPPEPGSAFRQF